MCSIIQLFYNPLCFVWKPSWYH